MKTKNEIINVFIKKVVSLSKAHNREKSRLITCDDERVSYYKNLVEMCECKIANTLILANAIGLTIRTESEAGFIYMVYYRDGGCLESHEIPTYSPYKSINFNRLYHTKLNELYLYDDSVERWNVNAF